MSSNNLSKEKKKQPEIVEASKDESIRLVAEDGSGTQETKNNDETSNSADAATKVRTEAPEFDRRYEVIESLGQGGMGTVYKVYDSELDKQFAAKVLRRELAEDVQSVRRFEQEIKATSELTHVNLVSVYGHGKTQAGLPYLLMDYVEGETLSDTLSKEKLSVERGLDIFIQTCEALAHAHMKGVVHRDLKPSNIMLTKTDSGADVVRVLDFGIAKILPSQGASGTVTNLTQTGDIFGSPLYMSPEQCENNPQDARSDIYALGCVMYEAFSGVQPFKASNPVKVILKHINSDPEPMSSLPHAQAVPQDLETIVLKCLEKAPGDRYQTVDELLRDLHLVAQGKPISTKRRVRKKQERISRAPIVTRSSRTRRFFIAGCTAVVMGFSAAVAVQIAQLSTQPSNPLGDSLSYDAKAYAYFNKRQYAQAAALLDFGIANYREQVELDRKNGSPELAAHEILLAENLQHVGKCYLFQARIDEKDRKLISSQAFYQKAFGRYRDSYEIWRKYGNYRGSLAPEAVREYAEVLERLGKMDELKALIQWASTQNINL